MKSVTTLTQNLEKQKPEHPDMRGKIVLGQNPFDAAVWANRKKDGAPYLSIVLSPQGQRDGEAHKFAIWKKGNRAASSDAHFRGDTTIDSTPYQFSGWLEADHSGLFGLRLEATEGAKDLSPVVEQSRQKLSEFVREIEGTVVASSSCPRSPARARTQAPRPMPPDDGDAEPDDIPFRSTIYRDVRRSRLNRSVL